MTVLTVLTSCLCLSSQCICCPSSVIATAGSDEKLAQVRELGADHLINYSTQDVKAEVHRITNNAGVHAVFDGVGKATFESSLKSLRKRGTFVAFGNASGTVPPID